MQDELNHIKHASNSMLKLKWEDNFVIEVKIDKKEVIIAANNEGLRSLANHLLMLAKKDVPKGTHIHLDEYNSLESNSNELIIEKI